MSSIPDSSLDQIFREARTYSAWKNEPISTEQLKQIYELTKMGPTSANGCPARFVFITTPEAKARLMPCMAKGNVDKTQAAPVTVIVAHDMEFYEKFPELWPHSDMKSLFAGKPEAIDDYVRRNGSLQGAYFILAARAMGLDCGPMSGFDAKKIDAEFFPDGKWKSNFLINLGHGDASKLHPRGPRMAFDEACRVF